MKKIFALFLGIALILPLYSQEAAADISQEDDQNPAYEEETEEESAKPEKQKKGFARQRWVLGSDLGAGFDNGLVGTSDILQKDIVIDMSKLSQGIQKNGAGVNVGVLADFFLDIKNIHIGQGLWNFGFTGNIDGSVNFNISKSLFDLIAEGNAENHNNSGKMSASGGIYTEMGLTSSAKYQVAGRTLRAGIKPAIFTPAAYISSSSGISYDLYTQKNGQDGLYLDTSGEILIYTPTSFNDDIKPGRFVIGPSGFDISLEGEYALFPSLIIAGHNIGGLDVGGSFTNIPFAPAVMTTELKIGLKPFSFGMVGEDLINQKETTIPAFDFEEPVYNNDVKKKVHRPFRFDVYARYKPLKTELLVIRPNIGFSVNGNKGDEEGFFNAGLEARVNLKDIFTFYLGSGYQERIWKQRMGLGVNLRVFEFDIETALRDQTFAGCFMGRGFNIMLGTRVGW